MAHRSSIIQVHHRGDRGVDGILRLIELAGHDGSIESMLTAMCDQIASITEVDIVSIYVREDGDRLVMRGNCGFPASAIGATTLAVGEGITGLVAECMRPVSTRHAAAEVAYKHVPGLGEERYPVFVGVPLLGAGATIGVLVLQRRATHFASDEVTLATALGAPIMLAIERRRASAIRSARLSGIAHVPGAVLGRVAVIPTATAFDSIERDPTDRSFERTFGRLRDDLGRAMKRLEHAPEPAVGAALDRLALALCDARLRERFAAAADLPRESGSRATLPGNPGSRAQPSALRAVAKEYARASHRLATGGLGASSDYAAELEELCALLGDAKALRPGAVWIADRIGAFVALIAVARGASALVASDAITPTAIAITRAARIPAISDVSGLFSWARPSDLVAVDGDHGTVLVHPAPSDIERLRHTR